MGIPGTGTGAGGGAPPPPTGQDKTYMVDAPTTWNDPPTLKTKKVLIIPLAKAIANVSI